MSAWDGSFMLTMQGNLAFAKEELQELDAFMASEAYRDAPAAVHRAVAVAWVQAKDGVALHRNCIADFCAPWFDGSAFGEAS